MAQNTNRTWYKYHFKVGNKIVHGGITHEQKTLLVSAYSPPREDYK